jgi:hypothetical protein
MARIIAIISALPVGTGMPGGGTTPARFALVVATGVVTEADDAAVVALRAEVLPIFYDISYANAPVYKVIIHQ